MENNVLNEEISMSNLMKEYDFKKIYPGEIVKGKVLKITNDEVFVNINFYKDGIIPVSELSEDKNLLASEILNVDDEVYVMVESTDDGEGNVLLSKRKADAIKIWEELDEVVKQNKEIEVTIKEEVKGGLVGYYKGIRIFMPASHAPRVESGELKEVVGQKVQVRVIELDQDKKKIVVSRRVIDQELREQKRAALWKGLKKGEKRTGKVVRLAKFGAFVDLGGIEGLIHLSDLSWQRIMDPSEVVSVGDTVEVFIVDFDEKKNRLALALKDTAKNPWDDVLVKIKINSVIEGKVTKFMNFGAFVEVVPGVEGLVHLAEISEDNIAKASDVLTLGQKVKVKVLDIDQKNHKMSLSIKDASEKSKEYLQYNDEEEGSSLGDLFGDLLNKLK